MKRLMVGVGAILLFTSAGWAEEVPLTKEDRVLIIAAHPLDEKVATEAVIKDAIAQGASVQMLYLTDGELGESPSLFKRKKPLFSRRALLKLSVKRRTETLKTVREWGLASKDLIFLGYPSGGLMKIWQKHWGSAKPYRSFFTRINRVPHRGDYSYGTLYKGENILDDVKEILGSVRPTRLLVASPEGTNADHKAAFLYALTAILDEPSLQMPVSILSETTLTPVSAAETIGTVPADFKFETLEGKEVRYALAGKTLVIGIPLDIPFDARGVVMTSVFGHRKDTFFASMPKLELRLIGNRLFIHDGKTELHDSRVEYLLEKNKLVIRLPLEFLKQPEHVFVSTRVHREEKLDGAHGWDILKIPDWRHFNP